MTIDNEQSRAQQFISQMGWSSKPSGIDHVVVQTCPLPGCGNTNYKFYIHIGGERDGLWDCKVCGQKGNIFQLKARLGIQTTDITSMHDAALSSQKPSPLPNFSAMQHRLHNDDAYGPVLDHLVSDRKWSLETIKKMGLGADLTNDGRLWYVIPYYDAAGVPIYCKYRTIPPYKKDFRAPSGRAVPLFNGAELKPGLEELFIVEGESDTLSMVNHGFNNTVGIPGANVQKAEWIEKLDAVAPKRIYLLFDRDKTGQQAAREMAARIGIERVHNILLPEFETIDLSTGETKPGKDVTEWFADGHTVEEFVSLQAAAKPFDVQGVQSVVDVLQELHDDIEGKGLEPTYDTPWPSLTKRLGGAEPGDVIGVIAEGKVGKTTVALNWLQYYSEKGIPTFMFCQEMKPKRMVRKWVSHVTSTDDTPGASQITSNTITSAIQLAQNMPADILFGYTTVIKPEEVFNTIRQAVRRYGVKVVCFDNLQLLVRSVDHAVQETSKLAKGFKALAMELNILLLLIVQPSRVADGQIVSSRNAAWSSSIEKDVDAMVCLHRNRIAKIKATEFNGFMETDDNFEPQMLVRVDLSRYSAGGITTLYMEGSTSTVREMTGSEVNVCVSKPTGAIQNEAPVNV